MRLPFAPTTVVALIEGLEGAAFVGLATYVGFVAAAGESSGLSTAVALLMTSAVLGLGALLVCRGLYRRGRWARAPAVVTQIFALPVAVTFLRSDRAGVGVVLALAAIAALVLLLYESVSRSPFDDKEDVSPQ